MRYRDTEKWPVIVKVEVGVMQPQTQGWHWKLEALGKVCPRCLRSSACPRLDLRLLVSRTGREQTPVVLSPLFVVIYSGRSRTLYSCLPPRFLIFSVGSVAQSCPTLGDPMDCSTPGFSVHRQLSRSLLRLMSIESVMPSNHLTLCRPLLLPSIFTSIRVWSSKLVLPTGGQTIGV